MKEKKIGTFKNNLNFIDDQIDELLNTSSYKTQLINRDIDEIENNPSIVSHLLRRPPMDNKHEYGGQRKRDKENFKTAPLGPSYLNGITILQNFEKTAFN